MSKTPTPQEIATQYAALRVGRCAKYLGGGWVQISRVSGGAAAVYRERVTSIRSKVAKARA